TFSAQYVILLGREHLLPLCFRAFERLGSESHIGGFRQIHLPVFLQFFHTHCCSCTLCHMSRPRQCDRQRLDRHPYQHHSPFHNASIVVPQELPKCAILTQQS